MTVARRVLWTVCLVTLSGALGSRAQEGPPPSDRIAAEGEVVVEDDAASRESVRLLLDSIRDDLVELRFEAALVGIEALLGRPDLSEVELDEALVLRSQAHVAIGDLGAAEQDYRDILRVRPGFVPDGTLIPKKAMDRFRKVQVATVGRLFLTTEPPDAQVIVDGREIEIVRDAGLPLMAGEHVLLIRRDGCDPLEQIVEVSAGRDVVQEIRLVPNARTIIVQTEPEGVDVKMDGVHVGTTVRLDEGPGAGILGPARLQLTNVSLGEHVFELSKPCYRGERRSDMVTVDLFDYSPKYYEVVELARVSSTLALRGGPPTGLVLVDGERAGRLPLDPVAVCPGSHEVEVRFGGRDVWRSIETLEESDEKVLEIEARPNVALLGDDAWPPAMAGLQGKFNETVGLRWPKGVSPSRPEAWSRVDLPPDTDLALARSSGGRNLAGNDWFLYSPILRTVHRIASPTEKALRPSWIGVSWGLTTVDSAVGGPSVVAEVQQNGAAARAGIHAGDRILSLGGTAVSGSAQVLKILDVASIKAPLDVQWSSPGKPSRRGQIRGVRSLLLPEVPDDPVQRAVRAAWATLDSICDVEQAPIALANLARLLSASGRHTASVDTWAKVRLPERAGVGRGTAQYYLGRELQLLGRETEAVEAHRAAAASQATALDDEGPRVAPAARDRLTDLGVGAPTVP